MEVSFPIRVSVSFVPHGQPFGCRKLAHVFVSLGSCRHIICSGASFVLFSAFLKVIFRLGLELGCLGEFVIELRYVSSLCVCVLCRRVCFIQLRRPPALPILATAAATGARAKVAPRRRCPAPPMVVEGAPWRGLRGTRRAAPVRWRAA